jgi:hypothetical protein
MKRKMKDDSPEQAKQAEKNRRARGKAQADDNAGNKKLEGPDRPSV